MSSVFQKNVALFATLHPFLALQLQAGKKKRVQTKKNFPLFPKEESDLLYIFGLPSQETLASLKPYFSGKKGRKAIFLEEDLDLITSFLGKEEATSFLEEGPMQIWCDLTEEGLKRIIWSHLYLSSECFSISEFRYKRSLEVFALLSELKRGAELTFSLYQDFGTLSLKNFFQNLLFGGEVLKGEYLAGKFHKIPAIICGAGPSLKKNIDLLAKSSNKALLFAAGSALGPLAERGIEAHFGALLDPAPPIGRFLRQGYFSLPMFFQYQVSYELYRNISGKRLIFGSSALHPLQEKLMQSLGAPLPYFDSGWTAATFATHIAYTLGCDPVIFVGMDFCVAADEKYIAGVEQKEEEEKEKRKDQILCVDLFGKQVFSRSDFLMGKSWIEQFAQKDKEREFLNATEGGLKMEGIKDLSFQEVLEEKLSTSWDLKGMTHSHLAELPSLAFSRKKIENELAKIEKSIKKSLSILEEILHLMGEDFTKLTSRRESYPLQEVELEGELLYGLALLPLWEIWKHLLQNQEVVKRMQDPPFEKKIQKLLFFKGVLTKYLKELYADLSA
ncbi:MAG: motility associated factor glycosyltransferase family protein [Simkania negevensis]|nr:motility associated factor glycosyltransferase family protein [Simkania negevensis]